MRILNSILLLFLFTTISAQDSTRFYNQAFEIIDSMVTGKTNLDFKKAVFTVENAYFDNSLSYDKFDDKIQVLVKMIDLIKKSNPVDYSGSDEDFVVTNASIFRVMTDTIPIVLDSSSFIMNLPFEYDTEDMWGQKYWSNTFVSRLLLTKKGNCHSLPFLYKILAKEFGIKAYLAFAPNHIYIKIHNVSSGWYNTELTSASFPVDAWIMASGYIHLDAVRNGLYMDTLSLQQSVAYCFLDLAQGYQRQFRKDDSPDFVIKCCNNVLKYHPMNVNAMLTKAEAQKHYINLKMKEKELSNPKDMFFDKSIEKMYSDMEQTYVRLHQLGYRRMPEEMYLDWMGMLQNEPDIYLDKKVIYKFDN